MPESPLVYCTECQQVYAARKREEGTFIQYTPTGRCTCENDTFREWTDRG